MTRPRGPLTTPPRRYVAVADRVHEYSSSRTCAERSTSTLPQDLDVIGDLNVDTIVDLAP